jgi:hypothetical protein
MNDNKIVLCDRCKFQEAEFECQLCKPLNVFCNKCDIFIHNLPSKKSHIRNTMKQIGSARTRAEILNYPIAQNIPNTRRTTLLEKVNINKELLKDANENFNKAKADHKSEEIYTANSYSKDYVNEIKAVFQKDKEELLFKNQNLQNHIDRLKISFNEQVERLNNEIEELQNKSFSNIKRNSQESSLKIQSILTDKDTEISRLKNLTGELNNKVNMLDKENKDLKFSYDKFKNEFEKKFEKTRENYENKIKNLKNNLLDIEK